MKPTNEQRDERYARATPEVQTLYTSDESGNALRNIFDEAGSPKETYREYALTIGDVILGFYPKDDLPRLLEERAGIDPETAAKLVQSLDELLAQMSDTSTSHQEAKQDAVKQQPTAAPPTQTPPSTAHTMRDDVEAVENMPSDTHTQINAPAEAVVAPTIPRYARPLTEMPSYEQDGEGESPAAPGR